MGLLLAVALAGCSAPAPGSAAPEPAPPSSRRSPSGPPDPGRTEPTTRLTRTAAAEASPDGAPGDFDDWVVGAAPLARRPDGFGQVLPTPPELSVRRLRSPDVLPPPPDGRFHAEVLAVTGAMVRRTDLAWRAGCPVALRDLRLLRLSFVGFDDLPHTGRLVVHRTVAQDVVKVFRRLFAARFPIERMDLVTQADLAAPPTGDGNTTAAYACRRAVGQTRWSSHALGLAVDLNPFMNPYRRGDLVLPELASAYLDRDRALPGMIHPDGLVVRAFRAVGWTWGGDFRTVSDLHHFSADGR